MFRRPRRLFGPLVWSALLAVLFAACAPAAPPSPTPAPPKPAAPQATAPAPPKPAGPQPTAPAPKPAPTTAPAPKPVPTTAAPPAPKPSGPSEWIIAVAEEAAGLDPSLGATTTPASSLVHQHLFDALIGFEGVEVKMTPLLAESWSLPDDRTWVFKLRRGVKFHNGDDFTADDVKYSLDVLSSEKSPRRYYAEEISSVELLDQYTIRLTTKGPNATLPTNIANLPIMPRKYRERVGEDGFARNPVGTGPYKAVEFIRGQRLVLEANPSYWRGQVHPKKLTLRPIADPSTRVAELRTGSAQIIFGPPIARLKEIDTGDTQLLPAKGARTLIHQFNTTKKPFDDVRARQAVNYAIDRDAIIKNVLEGFAVPLHGPFAPGWLGYDPNLKPYPYDPEKARQLLAEAGYPSGLETVFNHTSGVFLKDREIAEVVANQLSKVGIKLQLVPTDRTKLVNDWQNGVHEGITSGQWGVTDPDPMIGWTLYKRKGHKPDEKLNSLIEQSRRTVDPDQRRKVLQDLGRYTHEQAYWMFIHAQDDFWAKQKDVTWAPQPGIGGSYSTTRYYQLVGN